MSGKRPSTSKKGMAASESTDSFALELAGSSSQSMHLGTMASVQEANDRSVEEDKKSDAAVPDAITAVPASDPKGVVTLPPQYMRVLEGHTGPINSVAFSHDGRRVASGSDDETVRVWSLSGGQIKLIRTLAGHKGAVRKVLFSSVGLLYAVDDTSIKVWEPTTGKLFKSMELKVSQFAYSPRGDCFAVGENGSLKIYGAATLDVLMSAELMTAKITALAVSMHNHVLVGLDNGTIRLYNVLSPDASPRIFVHSTQGRPVTSVDFAPDLQHFASGADDETLTTWDLNTGRPVYTKAHGDTVNAVSYGLVSGAPTGSQYWLASAGTRAVHVYDAESGVHVRAFHGHSRAVNAIAFSPKDPAMITGSHDCNVHLYQWQQGPVLNTLWSHLQAVTDVVAHPDALHLASVSTDRTLRIWNSDPVSDDMVNCSEKQPADILGMSVATAVPDSPIALACQDGTVRVYDWYGSRLQYVLDASGQPKRRGGSSGTAPAVHAVAFAPSGRFIVTASSDGNISFWSTANRSVYSSTPMVGHGHATRLQVSADEKLVLAAGGSALCVLEAETGRLVRSLYGHGGAVTTACFCPRGKLLLSGCDDGSVRVWDTATWDDMYTLHEHQQKVTCIAVDPTDKVIASASWDGTIRLWSRSTGVRLYVLEGHTDGVTSLSFSRDGSVLFSGSLDRSLIKWDMNILQRAPPFSYVYKMLFQAEYTPAHVAGLQYVIKAFPGIVNMRSTDGRCLFRIASERRRSDTLKLLLSSTEAKAFLLDAAKVSALDVCLRRNEKECLKLLLLHLNSTYLHNRWVFTSVTVQLAKTYPDLLLQTFRSIKLDPVHSSVQAGVPAWSLDEHDVIRVGASCPRPEGLWYQTLVSAGGAVPAEDKPAQEAGYALVSSPTHAHSKASGSSSSSDATPLPSSPSASGGMTPRGPEDARRLLDRSGISVASLDEVDDDKVPVQARVVGVPGLTSYYSHLRDSPLHAFQKRNLADVLGTEAVRQVLDFKWNAYARRAFLAGLLWYCFFLALFTISTVNSSCDSVNYGNSRWRALQMAIDLIVAGMACHYWLLELRQFLRDGFFDYFASPWNYLDLVGFSLVVINIPYRIYCWPHEEIIQAIAALALWFKLLGFARAARSVGPFVRMFLKIMQNIVSFVFVLMAIIIAFSHGLFLLFRPQTQSVYSSWGVLFVLYRAMLGDFEVEDFAANPSSGLVTLYFVLFTFLVTVVMLNLLIAVMADIYQRVQRNVENEWLVERTKIILELEAVLPKVVRRSETLFPDWLHVLTPVAPADEAEPSVGDVVSVLHDVERSIQAKLAAELMDLRKKMSTLHSTVMSMTQQMNSSITVATGVTPGRD